MDVNHKNYEEYILDFLEGSLPLEMSNSMQAFLEKNPVIYEEVKDLDKYVLPAEEVKFPNKEALIRNPKRINIFNLGISGIAAAVALLLGYIFFINSPAENQTSTNPSEEIQNIKGDESIDNFEIEAQTADNEIEQKKDAPKETKENQLVPSQNLVKQNQEESPIINTQEPAISIENINNTTVAKEVEVYQNNLLPTIEDSKIEERSPIIIAPIIQRPETITASNNSDTKEPVIENKNEKQSLIDSVTNNIDFAENETQEERENEENDGFAIETIPDEKDIYVSTPTKNTRNPEDTDKGILSLLGSDKEEIKNALTPKSFGISIETKKKEKNSRIEKATINNKLKNNKDE